MCVLFLTQRINSPGQRLYAELSAQGHALSIEYGIANAMAGQRIVDRRSGKLMFRVC